MKILLITADTEIEDVHTEWLEQSHSPANEVQIADPSKDNHFHNKILDKHDIVVAILGEDGNHTNIRRQLKDAKICSNNSSTKFLFATTNDRDLLKTTPANMEYCRVSDLSEANRCREILEKAIGAGQERGIH